MFLLLNNMENRFKFLEHTADIKFQAFGDSIEECFENAGYALVNIICKDKVKSIKKKKISVKGQDKQRLLYDFLEEFLYLIDVGDFLVGEIKNIKIVGLSKIRNKMKSYDLHLTADVFGDLLENYETETDVKAITYNDMFIKSLREKGKDRFVCQVVVDV